jgi:hypothetical protein
MGITRTVMTSSALALALLVLGSCASRPDLVVHGRVTEASTGLPVAGARVHEGNYAPELAAGASTDADGYFEYRSYPEEHNVLVEKEGYLPYTTTVGIGFRPPHEAVVNTALIAAP